MNSGREMDGEAESIMIGCVDISVIIGGTCGDVLKGLGQKYVRMFGA